MKNSFSSAIVKLLRGCPLGPRSVSLKTRPSLQTTSTVVSGKVPCQKISNMCRRLACGPKYSTIPESSLSSLLERLSRLYQSSDGFLPVR